MFWFGPVTALLGDLRATFISSGPFSICGMGLVRLDWRCQSGALGRLLYPPVPEADITNPWPHSFILSPAAVLDYPCSLSRGIKRKPVLRSSTGV